MKKTANNNLYFSVSDHDPSDKARLQRMTAEFKMGFHFLKRLKKERVVSFFGSHLDKEDEKEYKQARALAKMLVKQGMVVLTGGGPGIMAAANRGALEAGGRSLGLNLELPNGEQRNKYVKESVNFHYLFIRRMMLAHAAQAYVFFPGGFGTLDEFFEISTLITTKKLHYAIPVVLVGRDYWQSLKQWLEAFPMKKYQAISAKEFSFWKIVDNEKEAFELLKDISPYYFRHESV